MEEKTKERRGDGRREGGGRKRAEDGREGELL